MSFGQLRRLLGPVHKMRDNDEHLESLMVTFGGLWSYAERCDIILDILDVNWFHPVRLVVPPREPLPSGVLVQIGSSC